MGRFLSHEKTKADLTEYLAQVVLKNNANSQKLVITSASGCTISNHDMQFEDNNHEEADTLMICLAAAASQRCPEARMVFFSPDTDVLVLAVAHYDKLANTLRYVWYQVLWRLSQSGVRWDETRQQCYRYSTHSLEQTMLEDSLE